MFEPFKAIGWVIAKAGCPMRHSVNGSDEVAFTFGGGRESFEFTFDAEALRKLIRLGTDALHDMDARAAEEEADDTTASG